MDAAVWPYEELTNVRALVVSCIVPNHLDEAFVGIAGFDLGKTLTPSTVVGSTKGASKFSRLSAAWMFTHPPPAVVVTDRFEPALTQPNAGFVWPSVCRAGRETPRWTDKTFPHPGARVHWRAEQRRGLRDGCARKRQAHVALKRYENRDGSYRYVTRELPARHPFNSWGFSDSGITRRNTT